MNEPYIPLTIEAYQVGLRVQSHLLLDVREPDEYADARIPGAILLPLSEIYDRWSEIADDLPVVVVCRTGGRSAMACEILRAAQFGGQLYNLEGGTLGWVQRGLPVDRG